MANIKEDINVPFLLTLAIISVILVIVVIVGTQAWFLFEEQKEINAKWASSPNVQLQALDRVQRERISGYHPVMVEKKTGEKTEMVPSDTLVSMPVERAFKNVIESKGKLP